MHVRLRQRFFEMQAALTIPAPDHGCIDGKLVKAEDSGGVWCEGLVEAQVGSGCRYIIKQAAPRFMSQHERGTDTQAQAIERALALLSGGDG